MGARPIAIAVLLGAAALRAGASPVGLVVEGVVRDTAGVPVPGAWVVVEGRRDAAGVTPTFATDADGRFRVPDVPAGDVVLLVRSAGNDDPPVARVETTAGRGDVVVRLEPGASLTVRIEGYVPRASERESGRHAALVWHRADGRRVQRHARVRADGWTRFLHLPKDVDLEAWALAAPGRPVRRTGLRPGADEVRLTPSAPREIRGRVLLAGEDRPASVVMHSEAYPGFAWGRATVADDGSFVVRDLVEGTFRVTAFVAAQPVRSAVSTDAAAGRTDVVIDLRDVR